MFACNFGDLCGVNHKQGWTQDRPLRNIDCKNESHRIALDVYYGKLVRAMTKARQRRARTDKTFNSQPGWNEHVSGLHKIARNCFRA